MITGCTSRCPILSRAHTLVSAWVGWGWPRWSAGGVCPSLLASECRVRLAHSLAHWALRKRLLRPWSWLCCTGVQLSNRLCVSLPLVHVDVCGPGRSCLPWGLFLLCVFQNQSSFLFCLFYFICFFCRVLIFSVGIRLAFL